MHKNGNGQVGSFRKKLLNGKVIQVIFTTGEVAKFCHVAPRTVSKWFDSGLLKGYRIPSSPKQEGDRRILREDLLHFLKLNEMPFDELQKEMHHRILLIGSYERFLLGSLKGLLLEADGYRYEMVHNGFDVAMLMDQFHPDTIVADLAMGKTEICEIVKQLRQRAEFDSTCIIALASEDDNYSEALKSTYGFNWVLRKPIDPEVLAKCIQNGLGSV